MSWDWDKLQEKKRRQGNRKSDSDSESGDTQVAFDLIGQTVGKLRWNGFSYILIVIGLLLLVWLSGGFYTVGANQVGVVLRFGRFVGEIAGPGPHYRLPSPIERVEFVDIVERIHIPAIDTFVLTREGQLLSIKCSTQYRVGKPVEYLFDATDHLQRVKAVVESSIREVIGRYTLEDALTNGSEYIQNQIFDLATARLEESSASLELVKVQVLYLDVPADVLEASKDAEKALIEKKQYISKAEVSRAEQVGAARGEGQKLIDEAEAYREELVRKTETDAKSMALMAKVFEKNKILATMVLSLETMKEIFSGDGVEKIIITNKLSEKLVSPFLKETHGKSNSAAKEDQ